VSGEGTRNYKALGIGGTVNVIFVEEGKTFFHSTIVAVALWLNFHYYIWFSHQRCFRFLERNWSRMAS
jgi:hypothetical protein